jgi:hypothetical protein
MYCIARLIFNNCEQIGVTRTPSPH